MSSGNNFKPFSVRSLPLVHKDIPQPKKNDTDIESCYQSPSADQRPSFRHKLSITIVEAYSSHSAIACNKKTNYPVTVRQLKKAQLIWRTQNQVLIREPDTWEKQSIYHMLETLCNEMFDKTYLINSAKGSRTNDVTLSEFRLVNKSNCWHIWLILCWLQWL